MCTAITFQTNRFYFGRNLDHDESYQEEVTVIPRRYPLPLCKEETSHYAIIGMAHIADGFPLMYDGINEKGLGIAGLNFVGFTHYQSSVAGKHNIPCYALIPWILAQCATVSEARQLLETANITPQTFRDDLPCPQLHWIIADKSQTITLEVLADGIHIHENPIGVLTNNPPFDQQLLHLSNFMSLSPNPPENRFSDRLELRPYSNGMGALGLPGDLSSQSRFVRAAFTKWNSRCDNTEGSSVNQFFHILGTVSQTNGCCQLPGGNLEKTVYTSCCSCGEGIYYYTTYENRQITSVNMHHCDLDSDQLFRYPLIRAQHAHSQN